MQPKIAFIGAGSTVFARNLLLDILSFKELSRCQISLYDINPERLQITEKVARYLIHQLKAHPTLQLTTRLDQALEGADYVISMIQVGGYQPATVADFEIPRRYGLQQTIGDTLGIGGIMRGLRTIPVLLEMVREMESLAPEALHLNYVNPLGIITWALNQASSIKTLGLCHSVPHTLDQIARDIQVPAAEIKFRAAGINHLAFFLKLEWEGKDLYPLLHQLIEDNKVPDWNRVRYDALKRLGYYVTESSEHFSEYVPWYIKGGRPDLIERYNIPLDEYLYRCQAQIKAWEILGSALLENQPPDLDLLSRALEEIPVMPATTRGILHQAASWDDLSPSQEYAGRIIHSRETGQSREVYANLTNGDLINNLPPDCCVEVPCQVSKGQISPRKIGALPPQLVALLQSHIVVQRLTVEAALTLERERIYQAALFEPRTAAALDPDQIYSLVDELLEAHSEYLPAYH